VQQRHRGVAGSPITTGGTSERLPLPLQDEGGGGLRENSTHKRRQDRWLHVHGISPEVERIIERMGQDRLRRLRTATALGSTI